MRALPSPDIDYQLLAEAVAYYGRLGFRMTPVPWTVYAGPYNATRPSQSAEVHSQSFVEQGYGGHFVASGEQSFLQMYDDGELPEGKLMCVTPCFRVEERPDEHHLPYFMKLELFERVYSLDGVHTQWRLYEVVSVALQFFRRYLPAAEVVHMKDGTVDIEHDRLELGSYGVRRWGDLQWIYGTGLALPRFSQAQRACFQNLRKEPP